MKFILLLLIVAAAVIVGIGILFSLSGIDSNPTPSRPTPPPPIRQPLGEKTPYKSGWGLDGAGVLIAIVGACFFIPVLALIAKKLIVLFLVNTFD